MASAARMPARATQKGRLGHGSAIWRSGTVSFQVGLGANVLAVRAVWQSARSSSLGIPP
ncbi:MAG: hypothetical protein ABI591_18940 [Kofleriaceae bacterium]